MFMGTVGSASPGSGVLSGRHASSSHVLRTDTSTKWVRVNLRDTLQFPVFRYEALLVAVGVCACLPLMWWLARRFRKPEDRLPLAYMTVMFGLAIGHLAKFAHTVLTMHPNLKSVSVWHYVPAYLMMALIVPAVCYVFIRIIRRSVGLRWGLASEVLSLGVVLAGAAFLFARADFAGPFRMVDRNIESIGYGRLNFRLSDYMGAQVINRALPDDSVIGSWDSGVVGYFSRFPVVNLDGLVNSYSYFHATSEASAWGYHKFKFKPPYREFGITHFANSYGVNRIEVALQYMGLPFDSNGRRLAFQIWSDAPLGDANASARFWEDMEPRFDYRAEGVGVIAAGRVAQAFAKDCAPDELVVWSWAGVDAPLPEYGIAEIRTGQFVSAEGGYERVWEGKIRLGE